MHNNFRPTHFHMPHFHAVHTTHLGSATTRILACGTRSAAIHSCMLEPRQIIRMYRPLTLHPNNLLRLCFGGHGHAGQ